MPTLKQAQQFYDAREPAEGDECDLGMVTCSRCGRTGNGHYPYQGTGDLKCEACGGRGVVPCSGCGECGRGERPEVLHA